MISVEDGLPSRMVLDAIQDSEGFMWFATANGLCRYDGNSFKIYNKENSSLLSNSITKLALDAQHHLIIQTTANFGSENPMNSYQVLDLNTYQFIRLEDALHHIPFKSEQVSQMSYDESGNLFFLTDKPFKLWQYSKNSTFMLRLDFANTSKSKLTNCVMKSVNNCILINFYVEGQFCFIRPGKPPFFTSANLQSAAIVENKQFIFYTDSLKSYVAIDSMGMKSKLPASSAISTTNWPIANFNARSQLFKSPEYNYYLLKDHQWIEIFNAIEQKELAYFGVSSYCEDNFGNFWFCTEKGIYQVNIRSRQFEHFFSNSQAKIFNNTPVRSIYVDRNQKGGKRIFAMVNFQLMIKEEQERSFQNISGITLLKKNEWLYVASSAPLLTKYNFTNRKSKQHPFLFVSDVWSIADYSDSLLLIGGSSGIIIYNTQSDVSRRITFAQKNIPPPFNVYRIIKTKSKGWIAVAENGIYFINEHCAVDDYYSNQQTQSEKRLPFTGIYDFHEDKEGIAWLATNGEGLIRWNWNAAKPATAQNFKKFTVENGLPDNILYRIEEDNVNNLWISSYNGLLKFNRKNFATKIYRTKSGLVNTEFNRISSFKDDDGILYFGGQNGIDAFDPSKMNDDSKENTIPFKLVGLSKISSEIDTLEDISNELKVKKKIVMNVGDNFLTISYSLLDFQHRPHRYAYRIDGIDKDWNYLNEEVIRISSLPYGKFKLRIKAQLESGNWNETELVIPIHVLKPFYLENWFIGSAVLLIVLLVYLAFLLRNRKYEKNKIILEQKVQQRTESLNSALSEKELLLTEIHHRVKNNLQVINGLLELRKFAIEDKKGIAAFNESQSGIMSIAMIHVLLYQNENIGKLEFNFILNNIISNVAQLFGKQDRKITFEIIPNHFVLNMDSSVTLGLIMNELLTNAFKYLPAHQQNKVVIKIILMENHFYRLVFHDNGLGLPTGVDFDAPVTIGFSMIKSLVMQLHGTIFYEYDQGSKFVIDFEERV